MHRKRHEYSKVVTSLVVATFSALAVGFLIFVCYEMHRQNDLSPVAYIGASLAAVPIFVIKYYMKRADRKSISDLEWEKTKRLTEFREKHPECFTQGVVHTETEIYDDLTGGNI